MADYRFLLVDASSGSNLGEMPLVLQSPFTRMLNGVGELIGSLPLDHPMASTTTLQGDREVTVLRDDVPVWNGPITALAADFSSRSVTVTAREASWYMGKRALEVDKHYSADIYYVLRNLNTYFTTKTGSGGSNINATLPRWFLSPASGNAGVSKTLVYYGAARHTWADIVDALVADTSFGLDYKMMYSGSGSGRDLCNRTLTFGSPSLGTPRAQQLIEHVLADFTKNEDRDRAATRVHTVGNGYTYTLQNTGSVTAGEILIESVFDRSDTSNQTVIQNFTYDARRKAQPPVAVYTAAFTPGTALPFDFCDVGDSVYLNIGGTTVLHSVGHLRVVQIGVTPDTDQSPELVTLTFNVPLDSLGT